ncbi:MAG: prephenate dehydrogenase/arogenate dehydrogenase family protein [Planctomycetota bacterium]|jgi:chorismate mutase/prephenate dehydrogenase
MSKGSKDIAQLREEIAGLDRALLELLERRFQLAEQVGIIKAREGKPVVVREVEQRVLSRARDAAQLCGVSPDVMESIYAAIIRGAVERQHRIGVEQGTRGGKKMLVLGAAGAMGGWLRLFLEGIGHSAEGVDPSWSELPEAEGRYARVEDVEDLNAFDAVFVSVPLDATSDAMHALAAMGLTVPVIEIASIKSQLKEAMTALRKAGTPAIALHPMFGPGKNPLEPLTMVHAYLGDEAEERKLILDCVAHPYLNLMSLPFDHHDRLMGWLLGLAHLSGILFADALSRSGIDPTEFERAASTTFARQVGTARSVLEEDPDLYFAIQRLNPFRGEVYSALTAALGALTGAVERNDSEAFNQALSKASAVLPDLDGI